MEALERRGKVLAIAAILFIVFWSQCRGVDGHGNSTKMVYVCPPQFIRLGHSCYYFSDTTATWQNALFACKDRDSNLTVPARWEDRNLRMYLNKNSIEHYSRWIGGIYDYGARAWKWGGELRPMRYQSFSKMKQMKPEELQWHCIAMMPDLLFRWSPRNCFEPHRYVCQTKLRKVPKSKTKDLHKRWMKMGKLNEITAPSVSREENDPRINDVTANPVLNPKALDLRPSPLRLRPTAARGKPNVHGQRPNELRKRSWPRPARRLTRPFPGYQWNRRDPEGSFRRNAELLQSGRTGFSPQKVKGLLARLQHVRDKQIARNKRIRSRSEWLVNEPKQTMAQTHARTYTVDNNISALHPKTIVEEFDMMPPQPPVAVVRPVRGAGPVRNAGIIRGAASPLRNSGSVWGAG